MVKWSISFQRSCCDATSDCSCLSDSGLLLLETTWVTVEAIIIMQLLCAGRKTLGMQARYWGETDGDYGWIKSPLPLLSLQLLVPKTWIILFDNFLQYCIGKRMCPWLPASTPVSTVLCDVRHIRYIFFCILMIYQGLYLWYTFNKILEHLLKHNMESNQNPSGRRQRA